MKRVADVIKLPVKTMLACALIGLAAAASAQTVGFLADPTATQYGTYADNGGANGGLNIGRTMTVTGAGIEVFQLGVYDYLSDGLAAAHTVTLFNNQTAVASVTVPAGTSATLLNAFRFEPLATPLYLPAGNYSIVAYQMNGTVDQNSDPYGNGNAAGFNGGGNVSPGAGIYDFVTSPSPAYPTQGSSEDFAAVSFTYTNFVATQSTWIGGGGNNDWSTAGNWNNAPGSVANLTFAGSTRLTNTNDLTGITADSLMFDSAAGAFVLDGNAITLTGNLGFNGNPAASVTQTVNLDLAWTSSETIDTPINGNLTLGGNLTSSVDTSLIKVDAGTLTLGGTNAILSWDLNGGTTTITGNTTLNGDGNSRVYVGDGDALADCDGTLIIQPGAVLQILGNYADDFVVGRDSGSGTIIQNGGTFIFNNNRANLWIGATGNAATRSEYDMHGGLLDLSGKTLGVGLGAGVLITGLVSQVSGVITNVNNLWLGGATANGYGIYTLSGGSIYLGAGGITTFSGLYAINLGGGTVGAEASWSSPLSMNLTGLNGPVTFNPAGNTIALSGLLSGNGGLTVTGAGTLELSGANTYTGDTTVNGGSTLQLDVTGSSQGAVYLANGAVLNLNFTGAHVVAAAYTNGVALAGGSYNATNLSRFITGGGVLTVVGTIPLTPTSISYSVSGGRLTINWPANYLGWVLQSQTNGLNAGLGTNWVDVAGSADVTSTNLPVNPAIPATFYRLRYP